MTLCDLCSTTPFHTLPDFFDEKIIAKHDLTKDKNLLSYMPIWFLGWTTDRSQVGYAHHKSRMALELAAKHCDLCRLINFSACSMFDLLETGKIESPIDVPGDNMPTMELFISKRSDGDGFLVLSPSQKNDEVFLVCAIGFCVEYDSKLADTISGRVVYPDPTSPQALGWLHARLQHCNEVHGRPLQTNLPTRVLDIGDIETSNGQIRLLDSQGTKGDYTTLSHCWGTSQQFTTTKATMIDRHHGISITQLPQTFQDAVAITREVGIRYLWVDSLCICQDDAEEWQRESSKMAEVYANSYLSIAAARSASDTDGFLAPRPPREYVPLQVLVNETPSTVLAFIIPNAYAAVGWRIRKMSHEPLSKRAWSLQERYLAMRTIHFTSSQLAFECNSGFQTEDGYSETGHIFTLNSSLSPNILSSWALIVERYSKRSLTRPSDKLPALSGLASSFHKSMESSDSAADDYVAGLWRRNLIDYLYWFPKKRKGVRPPAYRAPSWSWAALDGAMQIQSLEDFNKLAKIEEVHVSTSGEDPLGEVSGGHLLIRSLLVPLPSREQRERDHANNNKKYDHYTQEASSTGINTLNPDPLFDVMDEIDPDKIDDMNLVAMPIAWACTTINHFGSSSNVIDIVDIEERKYAVALIVQHCQPSVGEDSQKQPPCFRRLGVICLQGNDFVESLDSMKEEGNMPLSTII
ncbi:heterokaryon incompatibility protein-domain-containing protein [Bisporella sp. PMI_857]|nr:heterokaryon incompatibility protein-domain-containing protein [Bisporella sp. PMI_857]